LPNLAEFSRALRDELIFIVWLPACACKALGLNSCGAVESLPAAFRGQAPEAVYDVGEAFAQGIAHSAPLASEIQPSAPRTFAAYLESIVCDDTHASSDEEIERPLAEREPRRCSNITKKRPSRFEDPNWVESQRPMMALAEDEASGTNVQRKEPKSVFVDWAIEGDFDAAFHRLVERRRTHTKLCRSEEDTISAAPVNALFCLSRTWAGGWGGQCTRVRMPSGEYCMQHRQEIRRQGYLTHGRFDGPIPPKKRLEFEKWQRILLRRQGKAGPPNAGVRLMLTDAADFKEAGWRSMTRGQGESERAFSYRTGQKKIFKRPASMLQSRVPMKRPSARA